MIYGAIWSEQQQQQKRQNRVFTPNDSQAFGCKTFVFTTSINLTIFTRRLNVKHASYQSMCHSDLQMAYASYFFASLLILRVGLFSWLVVLHIESSEIKCTTRVRFFFLHRRSTTTMMMLFCLFTEIFPATLNGIHIETHTHTHTFEHIREIEKVITM